MKKLKGILWGLVLITIGVIIWLNTLEITNIDLLFDGWWTLFIIVPSVIGLITEKEKIGNLIGIIIGVALLLSAQDIYDFDIMWKMALPTIIILFGFSFIFKELFNKKVHREFEDIVVKNGNKEVTNSCATFSGQNLKFDGEEFTGATLNAIFGGIKCDLTKAKIKSDQVITATSIFGGIEIIVPKDVKVKVTSSSIFGGVVDKRFEKEETEKSKVIYLDAKCMFGGVDIK